MFGLVVYLFKREIMEKKKEKKKTIPFSLIIIEKNLHKKDREMNIILENLRRFVVFEISSLFFFQLRISSLEKCSSIVSVP